MISAIAFSRSVRKSDFSETCKGKATWAYSKQAQEELKMKCLDTCNSVIRPV